MKPAATVGTILLFVVALVVLGWNELPREGTAGPAPSTTTTAFSASTTSTTLPMPTTSTTSTTIPPLPAIIRVSVPGSLGVVPPDALIAVSVREAWVIVDAGDGPNLIGHLLDRQWTHYQTTGSRWGTFGLAAAPDGTIWAATEVGVFSFDGRHWIRRFPDPASGVAIGADGTVWVGGRRDGMGGPADPRLWLAKWQGIGWERVDSRPEMAPDISLGAAIAVVPDGSVWVAQRSGFWVEDDLMRYDGATLEVVDVPGIPDPTPGNNMPAIRVFEVEAAFGGDLWAAGYLNAEPGRGVLARYDGTGWALYEWPCGQTAEMPVEADLSAAPDGTMWLACGIGLWSFDGSNWLKHLEGAAVPSVAVASDGTVWYGDESGIHVLATG